jgi:hypothetical protein
MLSVPNKPIMLSVFMLGVIMLSVVMLNVVTPTRLLARLFGLVDFLQERQGALKELNLGQEQPKSQRLKIIVGGKRSSLFVRNESDFVLFFTTLTTGAVFTTMHFRRNLRMGLIS